MTITYRGASDWLAAQARDTQKYKDFWGKKRAAETARRSPQNQKKFLDMFAASGLNLNPATQALLMQMLGEEPGLAVGAGGALTAARYAQAGAGAETEAARKQQALMAGAAAPGLEANKAATAYLMKSLGKESPALAARYRETISGIGTSVAGATPKSQSFWSANPSRGRGEQLRAQLAGQEATNKASIDYALAQRQIKESPLAGLTQIGAGAAPFALAQGQGMLEEGKSQAEMYQNFATILSDLIGQWQALQMFKNAGIGR